MGKQEFAIIARLNWMVGSWRGQLGEQQVEEAWSPAHGGSMSTMIRVMSESQVDMIELINIRESAGSLVLHLRQFSPELSLRLDQDLTLTGLSDSEVAFSAAEGDQIQGLKYTNAAPNKMLVEVSFGADMAVTAEFDRL